MLKFLGFSQEYDGYRLDFQDQKIFNYWIWTERIYCWILQISGVRL